MKSMKRYLKPALYVFGAAALILSFVFLRGRIPSLHTASNLSAANLQHRLEGKERSNLIKAWGQPDGVFSGLYGDTWILDSDRYVDVLYDRDNDQVSSVSFRSRLKAPEDFSFSLVWNTYGISSYDSKTGVLIKENDVEDISPYTTQLTLPPEYLYSLYNSISSLPWDEYPELYDPSPGTGQKPPVTYILSMTLNGQTKTIRAENIADTVPEDYNGRLFMITCQNAASLLMDTKEWKSLPDYDHYFE